MKITQPGIFTDFPVDAYFSDPCPTPSLTQSLAKIILNQSPLHCWVASPRLNPEWEPDEDKKFAIGNVAHSLLLGRGKAIAVGPFADWRTKDSQNFRKDCIAGGKVPVLTEQYERAVQMVASCRDQLAQILDDNERPILADFDSPGASELMLAWCEPGGFWFRQLVDRAPAHCQTIYDYKTSAMSMAPQALGVKMADQGWDIQGAMLERGFGALDPKNRGRRKYRFICQETEYPFAVTVAELTEASLTIGRKRLNEAVQLWRACLEAGTHREAWPGYGVRIQRPEYPDWAEKKWLAHELEAEAAGGVVPFRIPQRDHMMGG